MFFNNNMRPAYAFAGDGGSNFGKPKSEKNENLILAEDFSEEDDSEGFSSSGKGSKGGRSSGKPSKNRKKKKTKSSGFSPKLLITIAIVVASLLFVGIVIFAIFNIASKGGSFKHNGTIYTTYVDSSDNYHIVVNGDDLKQTFENEIKLIPSANGKFAYITEVVSGSNGSGKKTYILEGKKLKDTDIIADEVIATAEFEPGFVYYTLQEGVKSYYHYSPDSSGPIADTMNKKTPDNFIISGDGSTVVYTEQKDEKMELKYYKNAVSQNAFPATNGKIYFKPAALSVDGSYIYTLYSNREFDDGDMPPARLVSMLAKDDGESFTSPVILLNTSHKFHSVGGINTVGNEIIITAESTKEGIATYRFASELEDDALKVETQLIQSGYCSPLYIDDTVCHKTFVDTYFICEKPISDDDPDEDEEDESKPEESRLSTIILEKDGARQIANEDGEFSSDGKYFYYHSISDRAIMCVKLGSKKAEPKKVCDMVSDFVLTESGNIYYYTGSELFYYDVSAKKSTGFHTKVTDGELICIGNSVYFAVNGEELKVYVSTDGGAKQTISFKEGTPNGLPTFTTGVGSNSYISFTDDGTTYLYYTKNGKKMSLVASDCKAIGEESLGAE